MSNICDGIFFAKNYIIGFWLSPKYASEKHQGNLLKVFTVNNKDFGKKDTIATFVYLLLSTFSN